MPPSPSSVACLVVSPETCSSATVTPHEYVDDTVTILAAAPSSSFEEIIDAEHEKRPGGAGDPGGDCSRPCFFPGAPVVQFGTVRSTGGAHRALSGPAAGASPGCGHLLQRYSRCRPEIG